MSAGTGRASNKDSGCDVFAHVPSDDETEPEGEIPDCDVMFEFSDVPILPVYTITLKENEGPRHYYLLKNVLQRLHMGKKELVQHFPDLYICNISSISAQVRDMRPSLHKILQQDKCFDIVKVTDTLDAALGYTREFLYPEHAHRKLIDLPDSAASRTRASPDGAAGAKNMKNGEGAVRVKRKYTKRNKDAQNLNKKAAVSEGGETQVKLKSSPKLKKAKNNPGPGVVKKITKCKKNVDTNKTASATVTLTPPSSNSDSTPSGDGNKEPEQDGGRELPVLEKHHEVSLEGGESSTEVPPGVEAGNDPEMPELTIAAF